MVAKNRLLCLLLLLFFFLIGSACLKEPYFPGKDLATLCLHISRAEEEKAFSLYAAASEIKSLQATISHHKIPPRSKTVAYSGTGEETIVFDSLYPGTWKIEVFGLDEDEVSIFYGESTLNIKPGETANVSITIGPAPGLLQVNMAIAELRATGVEITKGKFYYYPNPENNQSEWFDLELDGDWLRGEGKIPEGTYNGHLFIPQKSGPVYYQSPYITFTIQAGKSRQLTIEANGSVMVEGKIDSSPPPPENFNIKKIEPGIIELSWEGVNLSDLAGYTILRTDKEGRFIYRDKVPPGIHSYVDAIEAKMFWNGKLGYAVYSFDQGGNKSFWSEQKFISLDEL
ncbi:MAG: hypothetical protein GX050_08750 [Firmicutes bacterium]|nr:hypothetical protein [Bacillota bacterium]